MPAHFAIALGMINLEILKKTLFVNCLVNYSSGADAGNYDFVT